MLLVGFSFFFFANKKDAQQPAVSRHCRQAMCQISVPKTQLLSGTEEKRNTLLLFDPRTIYYVIAVECAHLRSATLPQAKETTRFGAIEREQWTQEIEST